MWRSRVLLPLPLPPMIMKMSPWFTVKFRSFISTKFPNAMVRSLTVIGGGPSADEIFARDGPFGGAGLPLIVLRGGVDAVVVAISALMLESLIGCFGWFAQIPSTLKTKANIPHATIT